MAIKITDVQITPITPREGLVAFASIIIDDSIYLGSIGVYTKLDGSGYRITYPAKKVGQKDLNVHRPTNEETSKMIEQAIISKARKLFDAPHQSS
jgi:stage V sporulation protein G